MKSQAVFRFLFLEISSELQVDRRLRFQRLKGIQQIVSMKNFLNSSSLQQRHVARIIHFFFAFDDATLSKNKADRHKSRTR